MIDLRKAEEPVTIQNLARRFGVSERTVYYYLASWRDAEQAIIVSARIAES
jgi:predicted DNA-binding transcriptional regulator YafY